MSHGVRNLSASLGAALLLVSGLAATVSATPLVRSTARGAGVDPKAMVLRARDIGGGFRLDEGHYLNLRTEAKSKSVSTALVASWGYLSGYEADYLAPPPGETSIVTSASVYRSAAGARAAFVFTAKRAASKKPPFAGKVTPISSSVRIGKDSQFYSFSVIERGKTITGYTVSWRSGRVGAAVVIAGAATSGPKLATVVSLARKQQTLILHSTR